MTPTELLKQWREEASLFRRRGLEADAVLVESYADELEVSLREWKLEALTLADAVNESGYGYHSLQKMVARGSVVNAGTKHRPRIRRCDLPRKPAQRSVALRLEDS